MRDQIHQMRKTLTHGRTIPFAVGVLSAVLFFFPSVGASLLNHFAIPYGGQAALYAQTEESMYNSAFNLYKQAEAQQTPQAWNSVITAFSDFLNRYPKSSKKNNAELFLGYAYLKRSNYIDPNDGATGREHLGRVIDAGKKGGNEENYRMASLQNAYSLFILMDYQQAITALERFISDFPGHSDLQYAYYYAGVSESNLGEYSKAQDYFSRCVSEFPNGALTDECRLERAGAIGRSGNLQAADEQFQILAMDSNYKYHLKAALLRGYLKIIQQRYQDAINLMEQFIRDNESSSANKSLVIEAYAYEAFCYMRLGNYNDALAKMSQIEQMTNLTPDLAFLKVQILTKAGQFDAATALLNQIQNSVMSLSNSDVISYYRAAIYQAQGNYNDAINLLLSFLNLSQNPTNASQLDTHYFDVKETAGIKRLFQQDFLNACGTLVLSYVGRYAQNRQFSQDQTNQEAVFQTMYRFAQDRYKTDPILMKIVERYDNERRQIYQTAMAGGQTLNPQGNGLISGGGGAPNPNPQNFGGTITGGNSPVNPSSNPSNPGGGPINLAAQPTGTLNPANSPANPSNVPGNGNRLVPSTSNVASNAAKPTGTPGQPTDGTVTKIDKDQAIEMYNKARELYDGNRWEEASEELLNLLMASDQFWTDSPDLAPKAALLWATSLFKQKKYSEAQTACDYLIKMAPQSAEAADAYYFCGYRNDYFGQREKAIEYLQKGVDSIQEGNFRPASLYLLAWNEWEGKNTGLAEKYFDKIYRNYQNSNFWSHAAWANAQIKYQNHEYVAAEKIVNDALATGPDKTIVDRLLLLKGEIALKNHDYEKARIAYETILREYPDSGCCQTARNRLENIEELKWGTWDLPVTSPPSRPPLPNDFAGEAVLGIVG